MSDQAMHYSELSAMRRCPQRHHYSYVEGLRAIRQALTLKRGLWLHSMLQADALARGDHHDSLLVRPSLIDVPGVVEDVVIDYGSQELVVGSDTYPLSWKGMLTLLTENSDYAMLPEEMQQELYAEGGQTLPEACRNLMRGYLWHYRHTYSERKPLLVEQEWTRTLTGDHPDVEMAGRADLVEIDETGRVTLVDWKTTKSRPGREYKLLESQRYIYAWGLEPILAEHNIRLSALVFDYLVTTTPTIPKQNLPKKIPKATKANPEPEMPTPNELKGELSVAKIKTTPLVYYDRLQELGLEMTDHHRQRIEELESSDDFFSRDVRPVNHKLGALILAETGQAAQVAQMFRDNPGLRYRNIDRSCAFMCDYLDLCTAELHGQDVEEIKRRDFSEKV